MAPPSHTIDPLELPASVDSQIDRRFPFAGGGGRIINPDDPQKQYRVAYCYHGWRAEYRQATFGNVRQDVWGCPGYVWGVRGNGDGLHCGYKETMNVDRRYGVTSTQHVNPAWDGVSWWLPEHDKAFFIRRQASLRRETFLASRSKSASPTKDSSPLVGPSSPSQSSSSPEGNRLFSKRSTTPPSPSPSSKKMKGHH